MAYTYHADTATARALVREAVAAGTIRRTPVSATIVCAHLDITGDELNSLFAASPVGGFTGPQVAERLRREFALPDDEEIADALEHAGVLTAEEADWLRDED